MNSVHQNNMNNSKSKETLLFDLTRSKRTSKEKRRQRRGGKEEKKEEEKKSWEF